MRTHKGLLATLAMVALLSAGVAQQAVAQPPGGMPGAGHERGFNIEQALARMKGQLNLDTSQQIMWDNAVAQGKASREAGKAVRQDLRASMAAELAKPEPDLAAMAASADAARADGQARHTQVRGEWLKLYATLSPAQKLVVRDALKAKMARGEAFRQHVQERMQQRGGAMR